MLGQRVEEGPCQLGPAISKREGGGERERERVNEEILS
jgi:hypothetical protein